MPQPWVGEIRMFAGNFAPVGWEFCHGQLLPISENETLFTLIGTTYGGDGQETFALPNLQGRVPIHNGTAASGTTYVIGESLGSESATLTVAQLPSHTHPMIAQGGAATAASPSANAFAEASKRFYRAPTTMTAIAPTGPVGGSQPHDNMASFLCINFIIAMFGLFPSQ